MKVSGFSFIRNAEKFDYPVREAILSVLPVCDEFVIAVGNSSDRTRDMISAMNSPKIRILDTIWDDSLREGGRVLASETNKALDAVDPESQWCFYIQGDEVLHEKYLDSVRSGMEKWLPDDRVEGLLFDYLHFYGSYDYAGDSVRWYRKEVRIIRNNRSIRSFRDAQGFQKNGRPLKVKPLDAVMYHYGWVKPPAEQQEKQKSFHKLWHSDEWVLKHVGTSDTFNYSNIDSLMPFSGSHPAVMKERILGKNWTFDFDPTFNRHGIKSRFKKTIEKYTGWRPGEYKNYRIVR